MRLNHPLWLKRLPLLLLGLALAAPSRASEPTPIAAAVWRIGREPLRIEAAQGLAGAVSSIRFRGREYIDAADHGRELQGAVQFGLGECLNPTLAGASRDRPGRSSSVLLSVSAGPSRYRVSTRMAYWLRPGAPCTPDVGPRTKAPNRTAVSDLVYSQDMTPGYEGHANAVLVRVAIRSREPRPPASVEALTGYMPPDFDTFLLYDAQERTFRQDDALADTSGERDSPMILSTADGRSAMGVVGLPAAVEPRYAGYHSPIVGKWAVVYHETAPFVPGTHRYACVWIVGTRAEVEATLGAIVQRSEAGALRQAALLAGVAGAVLVLGGAVLVERERRRRKRSPVPL